MAASVVPKSRFETNEASVAPRKIRETLLALSQVGEHEIAERRECLAGVGRFIGLDIHKKYVVVVGVDRELNQVLGPIRLSWERWIPWVERTLTLEDAVAVEMTTNTWDVHDFLVDRVHSVMVAHPPHLKLITAMPVMNDRRSSFALACLLASGLLRPVWVPDLKTREWRSLIAARRDRVDTSTQAKNRLHAILHRHQMDVPEDTNPFSEINREWWLGLAVTPVEKLQIQLDLAMLDLCQAQTQQLERVIFQEAGTDPRLPFLLQLPGVGTLGALSILGAIGTIARFPKARYLVGYAGLGARVHDSGNTRTTGGITKTGRKDLRYTMITAAQSAVRSHAHWEAELNRLAPRIGRNKAITAIARKLLVAVWHILTKQEADRFADPAQVARALGDAVYHDIRVRSLQTGETGPEFVRRNLDTLKLGKELQTFNLGKTEFIMPQSNQEGAAPTLKPKSPNRQQNTGAAKAARAAEAARKREELDQKRAATVAQNGKPRKPRSDRGVKRGPRKTELEAQQTLAVAA